MMISSLRKNKWGYGLLMVCLLLPAVPAHAARGKLAPPTKKVAPSKANATQRTPQSKRIGRNRRAPVLLGAPATLPIEQPLAPDVLDALAKGDLVHATRGLLMEPASEKSLYLLRTAQLIGETAQGLKPGRAEAHRWYLNLGIAYHNLFMFLQRQERPNTSYLRHALAAYTKARRTSNAPTDRAEADCLTAALLAASGKKAAAQRLAKDRMENLPEDFRGGSYLVTYYAALGDAEQTASRLRKAYQQNPEAIRSWLRVTDDLAAVRTAPTMQSLLDELGIFAPVKRVSIPIVRPTKKRRRS